MKDKSGHPSVRPKQERARAGAHFAAGRLDARPDRMRNGCRALQAGGMAYFTCADLGSLPKKHGKAGKYRCPRANDRENILQHVKDVMTLAAKMPYLHLSYTISSYYATLFPVFDGYRGL